MSDAELASNQYSHPVTETLSPNDYVSLFSSIASGVLAVVALALSIVFFVLSKQDAERSSKNAQQIAGSVERLEKLFDTLYSDTFSMMRDTYTDMRKHVWRAQPSEADGGQDDAAESPATAQTQELLTRVGEVSAQIGVTGEKLEDLQARLQPVLLESLEAESAKRDEMPALRSRILRYVKDRSLRGNNPTIRDVSRALRLEESDLVNDLFEMGRKGVLDWNGAPNVLAQDTSLQFVPPSERAQMRKRRTPDGDVNPSATSTESGETS